jgi:DNA-binding transcriptional ArsR family regulator
MKTPAASSRAMDTQHLLKLLLMLRSLPSRDSIARASILVALREAALFANKPVSVLWLAHKVTIGPEVVRHHLRVLRAEGAVRLCDRLGRTELFSLAAETGQLLDERLRRAGLFDRAETRPDSQSAMVIDSD